MKAFITLVAAQLEAPQFGIELATNLPGGVFGTAEFLVRAAARLEAARAV